MCSSSCVLKRKKIKWIWLCYAGLLVGGNFLFVITQFMESAFPWRTDRIEVKLLGLLKASDPFVINILKDEYLLAPSVYDYNLSSDPSYKERAVAYSWKFVHDILTILFDEEYSKFFVEAGALDGEFLSNTLWLEQNQNWTGLLVEPQPRNFQEMVLKRRKCWTVNACLSTDIYPKAVVMVATEKRDNQTQLDAETIRGGTHEIGSHLKPERYSSLEKQLKLTTFTSQCFPLYSMLLALNQSVIDFLSLDIQGTEIMVFDTIPLDIIYVRALVIEHETDVFNYDLVKKMNHKGFNIISVGGSPDYFFVNSNETRLIEKYRKNNHYLQKYIDENYKIFFGDKNKDSIKPKKLPKPNF